MSTEALVARFQALPPAAQQKVEALVEALSGTPQGSPGAQKKKRFSFDWAGGLEDLKEQFSAVGLQHHLREMR